MKFGLLAGLAGAAVAGLLATAAPSYAAAVDLTFTLDKDAMSSGTCAGIVCPTSLGTITEVGNTTGTITVTITLASGVSFHGNHSGSSGTGPVAYFDLTDVGGTPSFSGVGTPGCSTTTTVNCFNEPASITPTGVTGNFPGTYNFDVTCTNNTAGKICSGPLTFTVAANGGTLDFNSPADAGDFVGFSSAFVADLSIAGTGTTPGGLCPGTTACTGNVGTDPSSTTVVPEPSTWAMMLLGFAGLAFAGYRKTKTARTAFSAA